MLPNWIVLLPPVVILLTAFLSRHLIASVILGIASAALIAANFYPLAALKIAVTYTSAQLCDISNIYIYGFLIVLGAVLNLINATGAPCAFSAIITRHLQSKKTVESSSLAVSLFLGIDDYLNALVTGCIMKPLTDQLGVPRVKLAFLLDAVASPLVVLVPISSWIAIIATVLGATGIPSPFGAYMHAIPFIFYSIIVIASAWFIVRRRISYGPMATHENTARITGNLYGGKPARFNDSANHSVSGGSLSDFVLPIGLLILGVIGCSVFGIEIFQALMFAASFSLVISSIWALVRHKVNVVRLGRCVVDGFKLMYPSIILVFCALTLSKILDLELHTGQYLAQLILPGINAAWLPLIIFLMSVLIAFTIGSSWGTIAISTAICVPMTYSFLSTNPSLLYIAIGAIISGALAGAQLSPISDPVTMASTSSGCYQLDHVKTQAAYLAPIIIGTAVSFALSGFITCWYPIINALVCLLTGLAVSFAGLALCNKIWR